MKIGDVVQVHFQDVDKPVIGIVIGGVGDGPAALWAMDGEYIYVLLSDDKQRLWVATDIITPIDDAWDAL
jgi:hypothetical protein